jgi:hypothetical protein
VDTSRCRHARRQKSHLSIAWTLVTIGADLVSSCALEDVIRVVRVAELTLIEPWGAIADEIMAQGDVNQQISHLRHSDVADFEIGATATFTDDNDVLYLFLQKQKIGAELHIYLEEGTYHKSLFRGPNTNDMKK